LGKHELALSYILVLADSRKFGGVRLEVNIKLLKLSDYLIRKDLIHTHWIKIDVDLLSHPDFFGVTGNEFKVFVHFICVAGKMRSDTIRMNIEHTAHILQVTNDEILSTISRLNGLRWELLENSISSQIRVDNSEVSARVEKNRVEKNRIEYIISSDVKPHILRSPPIDLSYFDEIKRIKDEMLDAWANTYPIEWLGPEITKAKNWCIANPKKCPREPAKFLNNWFTRGWETYRKTIPSQSKGLDQAFWDNIEKKGEKNEAS
jgi:hypothetical protein